MRVQKKQFVRRAVGAIVLFAAAQRVLRGCLWDNTAKTVYKKARNNKNDIV